VATFFLEMDALESDPKTNVSSLLTTSSKRPLDVADVDSSSRKSKKKRRRKKKKSSSETTTTTDELVKEAREYLEMWSGDRLKWKFRKAKQAWILRWMYHTEYVNKKMFSVALPYLTGLQVHTLSSLYTLSFHYYIPTSSIPQTGQCKSQDV
jgi:hypothetical protein